MNNKFKSLNSNYIFFKAFTLVELIVGITISMLLMLSVSIFVSDGIKNITNQKIFLDNNYKVKKFTESLYDNLDNIDKNFEVTTFNSGFIYKINKNYEKGGFSFIGEKKMQNYYCYSGSDSQETNHIILKTFVPFEGEGGDIFNGYNFNANGVKTNMFSGTVNDLDILSGPTDVTFGLGNKVYISDTLGHSVYEFDKSDIYGTIKKIVGKDIFGDELVDGYTGTGVFLNNPTGLEYIELGGTGYLLISDTLNDRIIYLNLSDNKIYKLLGREDGLKEPTGIYYNNIDKTLYISNSGKNQIISYSSTGSFKNNISFDFTPDSDIDGVNKIEFLFLFASGSTNPVVSTPNSINNFTFYPNIKDEDYLTNNTNKLTYYFSDYSSLINNNYNCISDGYIFSGTIDSPMKIVGCNGSTGSLYMGNLSKTFDSGTNYKIDVANISGTNFDNNGPYYLLLNFLSGATLKKYYYFPYYVKGDDNLLTKYDNTLKIVTGSFSYPTGIYSEGNNLVFNDFLSRYLVKISKNGNLDSITNNINFDGEYLYYNSITDIILYPPVKNYELNYDSKLLNIYINYYKSYSCYGDSGGDLFREIIIKKSFK